MRATRREDMVNEKIERKISVGGENTRATGKRERAGCVQGRGQKVDPGKTRAIPDQKKLDQTTAIRGEPA